MLQLPEITEDIPSEKMAIDTQGPVTFQEVPTIAITEVMAIIAMLEIRVVIHQITTILPIPTETITITLTEIQTPPIHATQEVIIPIGRVVMDHLGAEVSEAGIGAVAAVAVVVADNNYD